MKMKSAWLRAICLGAAMAFAAVSAPAQNAATVPQFQVEPFWPKPLPNNWLLGQVSGIATDKYDRIWVVHRPASLTPRERAAEQKPPEARCCVAAPPVLVFDQSGNLIRHWGGAGQGYQWPASEHGIFVDDNDFIWLAGNGKSDGQLLKFTMDGKFVLQIGKQGQGNDSSSTERLGSPSDVAVDVAAKEVFAADGYANRRVVVFDSETGAYKRHWGAYGEKPTAAGGGAYDPAAPPSRQFRDVTCVELAKDGMVYVCDRTSNRIQVFQKDGKFVKEGIISKNTRGATVTGQFGVVSSHGSVWDIAFSSDAAQQHIFVADGHDKKVLIVQRDTLAEVGSLGDGGRQPGRFLAVGSLATDSRGNLYTGEQHHGKRVQKFVKR